MKTIGYTFIFLLWSVCAFGQQIFESGYIVDQHGKREIVKIKNENWKSNPRSILIKRSDNKKETYEIASLTEFGIGKKCKYRKATVDIDQFKKTDVFSTSVNPTFQSETHLLKVLVEGSISLYSYNDGNKNTFILENDGIFHTLIYKQYKSEGGLILENNAFISQMERMAYCKGMSVLDLANLKYNEVELVDHVQKYLRCKQEPLSFIREPAKKNEIKLYAKVGLRRANMFYSNNGGFIEYNTGYMTNPRAGLDIEYVIPSNSNKWSLILEPSYQ